MEQLVNFFKSNFNYMIFTIIILISLIIFINFKLSSDFYFARFVINPSTNLQQTTFQSFEIKNIIHINKDFIFEGEGYYTLKFNKDQKMSLEDFLNKFYEFDKKINFLTNKNCLFKYSKLHTKDLFYDSLKIITGYSYHDSNEEYEYYFQNIWSNEDKIYDYIGNCFYEKSFNLIYVNKFSINEIVIFVKQILFSNLDPYKLLKELIFLFF